MNSPDSFILAPIRGITNLNYRNRIQQIFGGIDSAIAPFIAPKGDRDTSHSALKELNNSQNVITTVPQILTKSSEQFLRVAYELKAMGHHKININLGCPYPMVASKMKGSGLLQHPQELAKLLSEVLQDSSFELTVKLRLGRETTQEFTEIAAILNDLAIKDITLHPRLGVQMYQGAVDLDEFEKALKLLKQIPTYNGDINTYSDYKRLKERFPQITKWMIGRGALTNPNLFTEIKSLGEEQLCITKLHQMIRELGQDHLCHPNGKSDFLHKMRELWEYLCLNFEEDRKVFKLIKKSKSVDDYWTKVDTIFSTYKKRDP